MLRRSVGARLRARRARPPRAGRRPGSARWPRGWSGRRGRSCAGGAPACGPAGSAPRTTAPTARSASRASAPSGGVSPAWASMNSPMVVRWGWSSRSGHAGDRTQERLHAQRLLGKVIAHATIAVQQLWQQQPEGPPNDCDRRPPLPSPARSTAPRCPSPAPTPSTSSHSSVGFSVRHLMVSKTKGRFADFSGTVTIAEDPLESSVEVEIQVASVDTRDEARDGHLRSPDFFDAETHPVITYRSTKVTPGREGPLDRRGRPHGSRHHARRAARGHLRGRRQGPVGRRPHRLHRPHRAGPRGLRPHLEPGPRDRRRARRQAGARSTSRPRPSSSSPQAGTSPVDRGWRNPPPIHRMFP